MLSLGRIAILGGQGSSEKGWEVPERDSCDSSRAGARVCEAKVDANLVPVLNPLTSLRPRPYIVQFPLGDKCPFTGAS